MCCFFFKELGNFIWYNYITRERKSEIFSHFKLSTTILCSLISGLQVRICDIFHRTFMMFYCTILKSPSYSMKKSYKQLLQFPGQRNLIAISTMRWLVNMLSYSTSVLAILHSITIIIQKPRNMCYLISDDSFWNEKKYLIWIFFSLTYTVVVPHSWEQRQKSLWVVSRVTFPIMCSKSH